MEAVRRYVIFLVEDNAVVAKGQRGVAEKRGHTVALETARRDEALGLIESGDVGRAGITVCLLDGNLADSGNAHDCAAGAEIAAALRARHPEIVIVGISGDPEVQPCQRYGDIFVPKPIKAADLYAAIDAEFSRREAQP